MTVSTQIKCTDCGHHFWWEHTSRGEKPPGDLECPRCDGEEPIPIPFRGAPALLLRSARKSADDTYRLMEESSAARAKMAADVAGVPESEMSHMKITNLKDNLREGDSAAVTPPADNQLSKYMEAQNERAGQPIYGFTAGPEGAPPVGASGDVEAAREALDKVNTIHTTQSHQMIQGANVGKYTSPKP